MAIDSLLDSNTLITSDTEFLELAEKLRGEDVYAIDTEFIGERHYYPKLALIQIAWGADEANTEIALVDPLAINPELLADLFEDSGIAILHSSSQDLKILKRFCGVVPHEIFDIQVAAGFIGLGHPSLAFLLETIFHINLPKKAQLTDWLQRPLSETQIKYAKSDVRHLISIYRYFQKELDSRGRLSWATEESEHLRFKNQYPKSLEEIWKSIKRVRKLNGLSLGLAIDLARWREDKAVELNTPVKKLLNDTILILIAEATPQSQEELESLRIVDRCFIRMSPNMRQELFGEILNLAKNAKPVEISRHAESSRIPNKNQKALFTLILAWINSYALDLDIHPTLLATRTDIVDFFASPSKGRLGDGWRAKILKKPLEQIGNGKAAIAMDDDGKLVLEKRSLKLLKLN